jgi:hypothetical protein
MPWRRSRPLWAEPTFPHRRHRPRWLGFVAGSRRPLLRPATSFLIITAVLLSGVPVAIATLHTPTAPERSTSIAAEVAATQLSEARASLARGGVSQSIEVPALHWDELSPSAAAPSPRSAAAMAYDPAVGAVVLFGGYFVTVAPAGDTWLFQDGEWVNVTPSFGPSPPARWSASMAFDPALGKVVMFGGRDLTQAFNDTWEYSSSGWTQVTTPSAPSPRLTSITYDSALGAIVLFGGGVGNMPAGSDSNWARYSDTWEFNASGWTNVTASLTNSPPAMTTTIAYDAQDGLAMIVGGQTAPADICEPGVIQWTFNGAGWTNESQQMLSGPGGAGGFAGQGMVFAAEVDAVVVFGGLVPDGYGGCMGLGQTWSYSNGAWTNLTGAVGPSPAGRQQIELADDYVDGYVLMFGGNIESGPYVGDTWALTSDASPWPGACGSASDPPPSVTGPGPFLGGLTNGGVGVMTFIIAAVALAVGVAIGLAGGGFLRRRGPEPAGPYSPPSPPPGGI